MKRWQDRGEVLDSEDEEQSQGFESQASERLRKKPRLEDESEINPSHGAEAVISGGGSERHNEGRQDDERHPRVVIPYDESARSARLAATTETSDHIEKGFIGPDDSTAVSASPLWNPVGDEGTAELDLTSSQSSESEDLPDIRKVFDARPGSDNPQRAGWDGNGFFDASSPLSERTSSPPAPLVFERPSLFGQRSQVASPSTQHEHEPVGELNINADVPAEVLATANGRRSLRARKENQLHPYMFEKAQYQKQCRDRGVRPIRYVEMDPTAAETQDAFPSDNEPDSPRPGERSNQPGSRDTTSDVRGTVSRRINTNDIGAESQGSNLSDDEELPGLRPPFQQSYGGLQQGLKRRKLFHPVTSGMGSSHSRSKDSRMAQQDDFSVPPSPPPTSSGSPMAKSSSAAPAIFRMPHGMSPAPLPTPQISSEVRTGHAGLTNAPSDSDSPRGTLRPPSVSRPRPILLSSDDSSESSKEEVGPGVEERRLKRDTKRIRGVLPASWLKIDFRAQQKQASPRNERHQDSSTFPGRTAPQKGVAQKVMSRRLGSPSRPDPILLSDGDSEASSPRALRSTPVFRQPKLRMERDRETTAATDVMDDERMEVDYVDPMLAGAPRKRASQKSARKKDQSRITDAFSSSRERQHDFAEERRSFAATTRATKANRRSKNNKNRERGRNAPSATYLSILDAPPDMSLSNVRVPQFVRLAMRQARSSNDNGRHSPTHKHMRLATLDDTEEAATTLRAWREGTIVPQRKSETKRDSRFQNNGSPRSSKGGNAIRVPLRDIQNNQQQCAAPAQKPGSKRHAPTNRIGAVERQPKVRQTQLQPERLPEDSSPVQDGRPREQTPPTVMPDKARKAIKSRRQQPDARYRGAQLESLEQDFDRDHRAVAFERRMRCLTENIARTQQYPSKLPLDRFLHDPHVIAQQRTTKAQNGPEGFKERTRTDTRAHTGEQTFRVSLPRRPRKRQPYRVDAEARTFRQPSEPLPSSNSSDAQITNLSGTDPGLVLHGLGPFGTKYATDFDIVPLAIGTYFHESSFIGSGDFAAGLNFAGRNLDTVTGRIRIHVDAAILEWGAWTEDVATGLAQIPGAVYEALNSLEMDTEGQDVSDLVISNVDYLLRSTVRYFARCLAFLDPVDRVQCLHCLPRLVDDLLEIHTEHATKPCYVDTLPCRLLQYAIVLARQAVTLSEHRLVQGDVRRRCSELLTQTATVLGNYIFTRCLPDLRSFYEDNRHASKRDAGIRDADTSICSIVILYHSINGLEDMHASIWTLLYEALKVEFHTTRTLSGLDRLWYDVFTIQPALELDVKGILQPGRRLQDAREDWTPVKRLVDLTLQLYAPTASVQGSTMNEYVRSVFTRCYHLVTRWGWWRCEQILGTFFDFFASRSLAGLQNEDIRYSPRFLEELHMPQTLDIQADDRSFHIFLKMLAAGLQGMRKHAIYSSKKIGGIAYRFIPNHGRTYRKDADVRQQDIDALRNHHDLLSTLHCASPPGFRPRVDLIRNLVDHSASHREACRVNVRAWSNLASFQVSTDEDSSNLEPFDQWFRDILTVTMNQYRLARSEVERDVVNARILGQPNVSTSIIEDTIARNQRQLAATLVDALAAIKYAIKNSKNVTTAFCLVEGSSFWSVFDVFDPSARRLYPVLNEALDAIKGIVETQHRLQGRVESQAGSDDSQEYGDFGALQELTCAETAKPAPKVSVINILHDPIGQLLSNVFGADVMADDLFLTKLVDLWTLLAREGISNSGKTWASYLSGYEADSWGQLRDTEQRRKYTPYLLARVVDLSTTDLDETGILESWLGSLVEREASLKFQHVLTNALLNRHSGEPLLENLPFSRGVGHQYSIAKDEFHQRRLALISAILSNMRNSLSKTMHVRSHMVPGLHRTYADMLRLLMQTMKRNYQELQASDGGEVADAHVQGSYVEFVQQVVSYLQQYTTDICTVDRFFTDSTAFPLPATDPTYVIGRLRGYVPRLGEAKKRKELAVFIQSVSERAVVDGQQPYLVEQFVTATTGEFETGNVQEPSLRAVLLDAVFPAYVENALLTPCSWIVALPILKAGGLVARDLLYCVDLENWSSVRAVVSTLQAFVQSMAEPIRQCLSHPGLLGLPHVQRLFSGIFESSRQLLPCIQHLGRATQEAAALTGYTLGIAHMGSDIEAHISGLNDRYTIDLNRVDMQVQTLWPDTREFSEKQVRDRLTNGWYAHAGQYYVKRGNNSVEVVVDVGDEAEEEERLMDAIRLFRDSYESIFRRRGGRSNVEAENHGLGDLVA